MKPFRTWVSIISLLSIFLFFSQSANACTRNNHVRPADRAADVVTKLFEKKNYRELNDLYSKYSSEKTATADGISALSVCYKGISGSFNVCANPSRANEEWAAHKAALMAWNKASPASNAPKFALALFDVDYAWYGRGGGYSSTVSDASRALFASRMSSAKRQLDALANSGKDNPAWYSAMLSVGLAQGWPSEAVEALYEAAIKVDPYYIEIHYNLSEYYSSKWYGSEEQRDAAIDRATESTRERLGQTMYARLHWTQPQSEDMFQPGRVSWERMKSGFDDYLGLYSENLTRANYADFACMANDVKSLKQQLDQLGGEVDLKAWGNETHYKYCATMAKNGEGAPKPQCYTATETGEVFCQ
jgi:hypothetical protein